MLVGLGVLFLGYSTVYYGLTQLRGQNIGYLDLVLPGRWQKMVNGQPPRNDDGSTPRAIIPGGAGEATTDAVPSVAPAAAPGQTLTA